MTPRKFAFDTTFDDQGGVLSEAPRIKRVYTAGEAEALRRQAFAEGEAAARASDEGRRAQALAEIAAAVRDALPRLAHVAHGHREGAGDLALAAARAMAGAALDRFPHAPLQAAIDALSREIDTAARLVVRAPAADAELAAMLEAAAADAGFAGQIALRDEPALPTAAFVIEWPDGRAEYDPEAAAQRVREALEAALAAEGEHAESLSPGEP